MKTEGKQTAKIFFRPKIVVVTVSGVQEVPVNWAGRVLPGQTLEEGIAAELKEVYGYTGEFSYRDIYFSEYAKDRKGRDIERYGLTITLCPTDEEVAALLGPASDAGSDTKAEMYEHFIDPRTPVAKKLLFYLHLYATDSDGRMHYLGLSKDGEQQYAADRVTPGSTLEKVITDSLRQGFGIETWRFIHGTTFSDDAHDKQGQPVQRVNVYLGVPYFETAGKKAFGMEMHWIGVTPAATTEQAASDSVDKPVAFRDLRDEDLRQLSELLGVSINYAAVLNVRGQYPGAPFTFLQLALDEFSPELGRKLIGDKRRWDDLYLFNSIAKAAPELQLEYPRDNIELDDGQWLGKEGMNSFWTYRFKVRGKIEEVTAEEDDMEVIIYCINTLLAEFHKRFIYIDDFGDSYNYLLIDDSVDEKALKRMIYTYSTRDDGSAASGVSSLQQARESLDTTLVADMRAGYKKSVTELWPAFTKWLSIALPKEHAKLNPPATFVDIEDFARATGYELPDGLKQLYKLNNGGMDDAQNYNFILSLVFLPLKRVVEEWNVWRDVEQGIYLDGEEPTYPAKAIKNTHANPKWVPFANDGGGNCIGVDLDPGEAGTVGQVINFGRDEREKFVIADSLEDFLALLLLQIADDNVKVDVVEGCWCISGFGHLTDALRKMIVPDDFVPELRSETKSDGGGYFHYNEYDGEAITQSFTVSVKRRGDEVAIESGNDDLRRAAQAAVDSIDPTLDEGQFTDRLSAAMPHQVGNMRLRE